MTTIASSIRSPTASERAISVMTLSVKFNANMMMKLAMMDVGSAIALIMVGRALARNRYTTITARSPPYTMSKRTSLTESRMNVLLSFAIVTRRSAGSSFFSRSIWSRTASATRTVLLPDCLRMLSPTACFPSTRAKLVRSFTPSETAAISERWTGLPPGLATMTLLKSSTEVNFPMVRRRSCRGPCTRFPAGISMFAAATPWTTSWMERLYPRSRAASTSTSISRSSPPTRSTEPTPGTFSSRFFITSFVYVVISFAERAPETVNCMIGWLAGSYRVITGSSISVGRFARAADTFSRTSCAATFPSISSLN